MGQTAKYRNVQVSSGLPPSSDIGSEHQCATRDLRGSDRLPPYAAIGNRQTNSSSNVERIGNPPDMPEDLSRSSIWPRT
jgi:hypothetical protein